MNKPAKKESQWKLVRVPEAVEPLPGVAEVRTRWLGKWVWLHLGPDKRVWVKIYRVTNEGDVLFGVVRRGVFLPWAACRMEHIPVLFKPVEE